MKFKTRRYFIYYTGRILIFFVRIIPIAVSVEIGAYLGRMAFYLLDKDRKRAVKQVERVFPGLSKEEVRDIARTSFENLGRNLVELINFPYLAGKMDRLVEYEGIENLQSALRKEKGVILITAHMGNWELLSFALGNKGFSGVVPVRKIYFEKFDRYINRLRSISGTRYVDRRTASREMVRELKNNGIVAVLGDQDIDSIEGVFVDFFGRDAYTTTAPAKLSLKTGAAMVPCFMIRTGRFSHKLLIKPAIRRNDNEDVTALTQRWSDEIDNVIREFPSQWVWIHRRWKTRPNPDKA